MRGGFLSKKSGLDSFERGIFWNGRFAPRCSVKDWEIEQIVLLSPELEQLQRLHGDHEFNCHKAFDAKSAGCTLELGC